MQPASNRQITPFLIAWCISLVLMESLGAGFVRLGSHASFDFRSFYAAGYLIRTRPAQLYDLHEEALVQNRIVSPEQGVLPFYHLAYEALIYAPFSLLSYRLAYLAFIAFNMLLLLTAFFAARPIFSAIIPWWQPRPGLMVFLFIPMMIAVALGQDSILSMLFYCLAWRQMESGKDASAGCLLALALFKFHIALPIAALMAIRRGWRLSAGFLLTSVAVGLSCVGIVGWAGTVALIRQFTLATSAAGNSALAFHRAAVCPSAMPTLEGFLYACGTRFLPSHLAFTIVAACSFGLFVWCARVVRRGEQNIAFSIAMLCGLLVSYHLYDYDLTLALIPAALLVGRAQKYLLLPLFGLPVLLLHIGDHWYFLLALPLVAMLAYASVAACEMTASPEMPHTIPA